MNDSTLSPISEKNTPLLTFLAKTGAPRSKWTRLIMQATGCSRVAACAMQRGGRVRATSTAAKIAAAADALPPSWVSEVVLHMVRLGEPVRLSSGGASLAVPLSWERALLLIELLRSLSPADCL